MNTKDNPQIFKEYLDEEGRPIIIGYKYPSNKKRRKINPAVRFTFRNSGRLNPKKDGTHLTYYHNGKLQKEQKWRNKKIVGDYKCWYDNGQLDEQELVKTLSK